MYERESVPNPIDTCKHAPVIMKHARHNFNKNYLKSSKNHIQKFNKITVMTNNKTPFWQQLVFQKFCELYKNVINYHINNMHVTVVDISAWTY